MTAEKKNPKRKQFSVRLSPSIVKKPDHLAVDAELSRNKLVEEAVEDVRKKYNNHKPSGELGK